MFENLVDSPWAAIAAMAGVTLALRLGGYWLMGHVKLTARVSRGLEALPGCIFIAVALPLAAGMGAAGLLRALGI